MPALKLHELRHTFGTLAASGFDLVNVQFMMGHADSRTTARYLHARPADDDAARLSKIFGDDELGDGAARRVLALAAPSMYASSSVRM